MRVDHDRIQKMYGQAVVEVYLLIRQPARSVVHLRLVAGLLFSSARARYQPRAPRSTWSPTQ